MRVKVWDTTYFDAFRSNFAVTVRGELAHRLWGARQGRCTVSVVNEPDAVGQGPLGRQPGSRNPPS